ncbi:hypothetical protein M3Y95_00747500 [Aphelenchoides besseyi]|nr:hypothetical protein M3Y95_00747500 [Aphelenchoides besseyi]
MSVPVRQKYELLSLPGWNRAEPIRMLFKLAGQEFTDCRLSIPEWRAFKLKASLPPEARLPLLRINSRLTVVGAGEIGRLLAREFGFYAETTIESHYLEQINQYLELLNRGLLPIVRDILSKNEKLRMQHWDEYKHELLRPILEVLNCRLVGRKFFVSDRITWADVGVAEILMRFDNLFDSDFLREFPQLDEHRQRIANLPPLREDQRPRSII